MPIISVKVTRGPHGQTCELPAPKRKDTGGIEAYSEFLTGVEIRTLRDISEESTESR